MKNLHELPPNFHYVEWAAVGKEPAASQDILSKGSFLCKREVFRVAPIHQLDSSYSKALPLLPVKESRYLVQNPCKTNRSKAGECRESAKDGV